MLDGILIPALRDIDYLAPCAPYPAIPSGVTVHEKSIYRYSVPTDDQPTLLISDYISDFNGNFIKPGYYELALSDDKEFLYIIESKDLIAVVPVFKLTENKAELKKYQDKTRVMTKQEKRLANKKERVAKKKEKMRRIIEAKYGEVGATPPPKEYEHLDASIDYIKEGGYYLIRYEKGPIRAFGAIRAVN